MHGVSSSVLQWPCSLRLEIFSFSVFFCSAVFKELKKRNPFKVTNYKAACI